MFSHNFILFALIVSISSLKNGDYMEFYVSGKDLPGVNGDCGVYGPCEGTGRFGFEWMSGKLFIGGRLTFDVKIESELIENKSPIWSNDIRNITHVDTSVSWSMQRMVIEEEAKTTFGLSREIVAILYDMSDYKLEENIAKSCTTKEPFVITEKAWTDKNHNITLLFHCTKFVPVR